MLGRSKPPLWTKAFLKASLKGQDLLIVALSCFGENRPGNSEIHHKGCGASNVLHNIPGMCNTSIPPSIIRMIRITIFVVHTIVPGTLFLQKIGAKVGTSSHQNTCLAVFVSVECPNPLVLDKIGAETHPTAAMPFSLWVCDPSCFEENRSHFHFVFATLLVLRKIGPFSLCVWGPLCFEENRSHFRCVFATLFVLRKIGPFSLCVWGPFCFEENRSIFVVCLRPFLF